MMIDYTTVIILYYDIVCNTMVHYTILIALGYDFAFAAGAQYEADGQDPGRVVGLAGDALLNRLEEYDKKVLLIV